MYSPKQLHAVVLRWLS